MAISSKALVVGCSASSGFIYDDNVNDSRIWPARLFGPHGISFDNLSFSGVDNQWIFLETMGALIRDSYDLVLVQWTELGRMSVNVGLETWNTHLPLSKIGRDVDIHGGVTIPAKYFAKLYYDFKTISNLHWPMLNLVKYVNVLIEIQKSRGQKIFFINGKGHWPKDYFTRKEWTVPSELSLFERNILDSDNRSDEETKKLYNIVHDHYDRAGGIRDPYWLNLYASFFDSKIDSFTDGDAHPGDASQGYFAEWFGTLLRKEIAELKEKAQWDS